MIDTLTTLDFATVAPLAVLMLCIGLMGGFLSGLLGIGGGFLLVPGLFYSLSAMGFETAHLMHISVGTSLAIIVPTVFTSARAHYKNKSVDVTLFKDWSIPLIFGVFIGVFLASLLSSKGLTLVFASIAFVTAIYMSFSKESHHLKETTPKGIAKYITAASIGIVTSLMGIGGAIVSVPTMTAFNVPIQMAIGTAASMGILTSFLGVIGYIIIGLNQDISLPFSFGYVNILAAVLIMPASIMMAPFGAKVAHKVSRKTLKRIFAILLGLISIKMFYGAGALP